MRRVLVLKFYLMAVMTLFLVSGCASVTGRTADQTIADDTITSKINAKIIQDPDLSYLKINVDTFQGRVTLTGAVPTQEAKDRLVELARNTEGVTSVKTNLVIQPG